MFAVLEIEGQTHSNCVVTLEDTDIADAGAAITRLQSAAARNMALTTAVSRGKVTGTVGISGTVANPYPVNSQGKGISFEMVDDNGQALPANSPDRKPVAYRIKYAVTAR